jgi:signal transduction histidine kinase
VVLFVIRVLTVNLFDTNGLFVVNILIKIVAYIVIIRMIIQFGQLQKASRKLAEGDLSYEVDTSKLHFEFKEHGENLNRISEGMAKAVEEKMKSERFKTELITNVSHDIKTPLTSIINYVDLLGKEELDNEKASEYIEVLERQSSKLKKLIEDLVEASKASSGSLSVNNEPLEAGVFITQAVGEFEEKLSDIGLELIITKPDEPVYIMADGKHLWRVVDNLMGNIIKYAQPSSRVYVSLEADASVRITFRNISKYQLNVSGDELLERFVRGDKSRNTEGHGLGLSIAQSLISLMGGSFDIIVDGDLFKTVITFDRHEN